MESKAKLSGHPAHRTPIVFPLGLLAASAGFDAIHLTGDFGDLAAVAFWLITAGLVGRPVAAARCADSVVPHDHAAVSFDQPGLATIR